MTTLTTLRCALENERETLAVCGQLHLKFQRTPYTPQALLAVTAAHRSAPEPDDILSLLRLARDLPKRVWWWSGPRSGATQSHCHGQGHLRMALGGSLPIEQTSRKEFLQLRGVTLSRIEQYPLPGISISLRKELELAARVASVCTSELHAPYNLILPHPHELLIIPRTKAAPAGWDKTLGGAEVAGIFIFTQTSQRSRLTYGQLWTALAEVGFSQGEQVAWEQRICQRLSQPVAKRGSRSNHGTRCGKPLNAPKLLVDLLVVALAVAV